MSEPRRPPRPERVRVTRPPQRSAGRARAGELAETRLGGVYMRSLLREQLRLAWWVLGALTLGVGALPLLFWAAPALAGVHLVGVPLPWLLLGVAVYPFLLALGWWYVVRAERNERDFAELLEGSERP